MRIRIGFGEEGLGITELFAARVEELTVLPESICRWRLLGSVCVGDKVAVRPHFSCEFFCMGPSLRDKGVMRRLCQ